MHDVLVLGAGVAGLACACALAAGGARVQVVDRADKPGGRCATRWHDGEAFDYGPLFLHGSDPAFLEEIYKVDDSSGRQEGWPRRVNGSGAPCQPRAFLPHETRVAFGAGLHAFARQLARGLDVRLHTQVTAVRAEADGIAVETSTGERLRARDVVIAFALEQAVPLVHALGKEAQGIHALLRLFASVPCLALAAGYSAGVPEPDWDVSYPEQEDTVLLVSNERSKRPAARSPVLVIQATARWSRRHLERPKEAWTLELIAAAARRLGAWASSPQWVHAHRWRYSRLDPANELAAPVVAAVGGSRVGLAGDLFAPGGGIQAAWQSGVQLARMLRGG